MKEIEEDTNKWKGILYPWIGGVNIVKILTPPIHGLEELILLKYQYNQMPPIDSLQCLSRFQWYF